MKFVLSIDGGGIRGVIPATILAHLEKELGMPLYKCFDLISGTSTGAIIAAGLSLPKNSYADEAKYTASDILDFYVHDSKEIFSNQRNWFKRIISSKYPSQNLAQPIFDHIGSGRFDEMLTKVMIPAYDISNRRPYFFKSWKYSVRDIATHRIVCASASAPTYFPPTRINFKNGVEAKYLIDGFVAANNPAMCAYCEARRLWGDEDIFMLSIGAGDISDPVTNVNHKHWGIFTWIPRLFSIMMDAPINTVDYQMHTLAPDMYVRLQLKVRMSSEKIDDASITNIQNLQTEANSLILCEGNRLERVISLIKDFKKD